MTNVVLLGSTGSIGTNALRVADALPSHLKIVGLTAQRNDRLLLEQAARFGVRQVALVDPVAARRAAAAAPAGVTVHSGPEGVATLAGMEGVDIVLCAVVGIAGLRPVMAAIARGADVALATKEVLVAAGGIVTDAARAAGVRLRPVDSEHCAIFQCLQGQDPARVRRILLTASGGPFAADPGVNFDTVTVEQALNHPRWNMGRKVTIDSATLMNKGLEIIEAHWLFDMPVSRIDVLVHTESIVHSMVEFVDGNLLAQLSVPDMRGAIQYALTYPHRLDGGLPRLDLTALEALHFRHPDERRFPALRLAREAAERGGTYPAVLNAANEVAVEKFLARQIPFSGIWTMVEATLAAHTSVREPAIEDIMAADAWARSRAGKG